MLRTIVLGAKFRSNTITEFDIDGNGLDELYSGT
jgi:hypothetical protein